jgi:quercetin dioxygenase-like cupin family protein
MATHFEHYRSGDLYGIFYSFDQDGDAIPQHLHTEEMFHNIIVLEGKIALEIEGDRYIVKAGAVLDFDGSKEHRVCAVEGPARVLHMYLSGIPEGYDTLPASELKGTLNG